MRNIVEAESVVKACVIKLQENCNDETKGDLYLVLKDLIDLLIYINYPEIFEDTREDISHELSFNLMKRVSEGFIVFAWTKYLRFKIRHFVYEVFRKSGKKDLNILEHDFPCTGLYSNPERITFSKHSSDKILKSIIKDLRRELSAPKEKFNIYVYLIFLSITSNLNLYYLLPKHLGSRLKLYKEKLCLEKLGILEKELRKGYLGGI